MSAELEQEALQKTGCELIIRTHWAELRDNTRRHLVSAGAYSETGVRKRIDPEYFNTEVTALEIALGRMRRCMDAKRPEPGSKAKDLVTEYLDAEESLHLVLAPDWARSEPVFLRYALHALRRCEMAKTAHAAIPLRPSIIGGAFRVLLSFIGFLLLLASPYMLAMGLAASSAGDVGQAARVFYLIAGGAYALYAVYVWGRGGNTKSRRVYIAWERLDRAGLRNWATTGSAAAAFQEDLLRQGLPVPLVGIDIARSLEHAVNQPK